MKIKLTPELSYIIGLWRGRKAKEGLGVFGSDDVIQVFSMEVIKQGLTPPNKLQMRDERAFFYHSKLRLFFQEIAKERLERYKYENKFSASYLAGRFDSTGGYNNDNKSIYLAQSDKVDEMVILRLGFKAKLVGKKIIIIDKEKFLDYIKHFRKIKLREEQ